MINESYDLVSTSLSQKVNILRGLVTIGTLVHLNPLLLFFSKAHSIKHMAYHVDKFNIGQTRLERKKRNKAGKAIETLFVLHANATKVNLYSYSDSSN